MLGYPSLKVGSGFCNQRCAPVTLGDDEQLAKDRDKQQDAAVLRLVRQHENRMMQALKRENQTAVEAMMQTRDPAQTAEQKQAELTNIIRRDVAEKLPSDLARLTALDAWIRDKALPFYEQTQLYFATRDHMLARLDVCGDCEKFVTEGDGKHRACSECGCRLGKINDDGDDDPNKKRRLLASLGQKGKTAEAVRVANGAWYLAKKCPHPAGNRWGDADAEHMQPEHKKIRDSLYE